MEFSPLLRGSIEPFWPLAPPFAPLLFSNLMMLGLIALWRFDEVGIDAA
jgi:hypothetical protein